MTRPFASILAVAVCLAGSSSGHQLNAKELAPTCKSIEGSWSGTWGGGSGADGVVYQPVIAEMSVYGDQVTLTGFPKVDDLTGAVRFAPNIGRMTITPTEKSAKVIVYTCKFQGNQVTLTDADGFALNLRREYGPSPPPRIEFRQAGDDLLVTTAVEVGSAPYVLWSHAEIDENVVNMGPPVGDMALGKPQVTLYYYVFQARDDPAAWNTDERWRKITLTWRLAGHRKADEIYRVRREFIPSQQELVELLPKLQKLAGDVRDRQDSQLPPMP